jgi:hypothetical protein
MAEEPLFRNIVKEQKQVYNISRRKKADRDTSAFLLEERNIHLTGK